MPDDVLEMADRLWRGEVPSSDYHPVSHLGGLAEICDGVAFAPSFGNVSAITTQDGLVLVDTGSSFVAAAVHAELRRWTSQRLHTAVYSHGHIDHVGGVQVWEAESAENGWPAPDVVAHEALPLRFDRYVMTAGYNEVINQRQFGVRDLRWPRRYRYPDHTYRDQLQLEVGGSSLVLRHEKGETDDHTVTWLAGARVLCCGDLFIWASPNAGNPQKVQRYPKEWAGALRRMIALQPECLLPGHGLPVIGAARVRQALGDTAELLDALVDQTLEVMNGGGRLDEAIHSVRPPAHLMARPYLQPVYDEPEFIIRNVWRLYGGWWDGNPATLKPAPERALATELAALAGGAAALADRAHALADRALALTGEAGRTETATEAEAEAEAEVALRLAGHLAELAWLAAPEDRAIADVRHRVFSARADGATSTMARGVFRWAASETLDDPLEGLSSQGLPGLNQRPQLRQPADDRIGHGVVERRHVAVRDQYGAHADAFGPVYIVERPVADEYACLRIVNADRGHRCRECPGVRLGPADLAAVGGAVNQGEHAVAAEDLLVPAPRPHGVRQDADLDVGSAQLPEQLAGLRVGERVRVPCVEVAGQECLGRSHPGALEHLIDCRAAVFAFCRLPQVPLGCMNGCRVPRRLLGCQVQRADIPPERLVVHRVPWGQRPAPVEDDRLHRHELHPMRSDRPLPLRFRAAEAAPMIG
jgi:glyoxylase-like metal-dependent hydrolase (beta-lactamase superfamily II)